MNKNILITGLPGDGKTALIIKLCVIFKEFNPAGFYTVEIMEEGVRTGFEVISLYGARKIFAHVNLKTKHSVGKYKVDVKGFEEFLVSIVSKEKKTGLYFIDEISKMACESKKFSKLLVELLNSGKPVVASIAEKGTGLISEIKKRDDIRLFEIGSDTLDLKLKELTMTIRDLLLE